MRYEISTPHQMPLSEEQRAAYEACLSGKSVAVKACAGSGKSHTLKATAINSSRNVMCIPFGRSLADDQRAFFTPHPHCDILNFHRYSLRMIGNVTIDDRKLRTIALNALGEDGDRVAELVKMLKTEGYGLNVDHLDADEIAFKYGFKEELVDGALTVLELSDKDRKTVDFEDMLRFAILNGKQDIQPDRIIMLDEVQDYTMLSWAWLKSCIVTPDSHVFMVGDPDRQCLMQFAGAKPELFDEMAEYFSCVRHSLTYNRRCAKRIVAAAPYAGDMKALPDAPEGTVDSMCATTVINDIADGLYENDAVLSEANAPLVTLGINLLTKNIPVRMRDKKLNGLILRYAMKYMDTRKHAVGTVAELVGKDIDSWEAEGGDVAEARDIQKCIAALETYCLSKGIVKPKFTKQGSRWIPVHPIQQALAMLTDEKKDKGITLMTGHTAKGLEWHTVFYLPASMKAPTQEWQVRQNECLDHVIATRAIERFIVLS